MLPAVTKSINLPLKSLLGAIALLALASCGGGDSTPAPTAPSIRATPDNYTLAWQLPATLSVTDNDVTGDSTPTVSLAVLPKHGSAQVQGARVVYTPQSGFFGQDSFSYQLGTGASSQTATVTLTVEAGLTLQGRVTGLPLANPTVKATVGGQDFTTFAGADGQYSLAIKASQASDFITLTASGAGAQATTVMRSWVGEAGRLAAAAKDGRIAADQQPSLNITPVSTAQSGLISQTGSAPSSDAALGLATLALKPQDLLDGAAVVKRVATGGVGLPAGAADTLALVSNRSSFASMLATLMRDQAAEFEAVRQSIRSDAQLSQVPPTPPSGGQPVTLIYAYGPESSTTSIRVLTLKSDGTGTEVSSLSRNLTWVLNGPTLAVTYNEPPRQLLQDGETFLVGDQPVVARGINIVTITGLQFTDIGAPSAYGALSAVRLNATVEAVNGSTSQVIKTVSGGVLMRRHVPGALAVKPEDFAPGLKLAGLSGSLGTTASSDLLSLQDIATFTSATELSLRRTGQQGRWQVVDGKLHIDLQTESHLYTPLGTGPLGDKRWLLQVLDARSVPVSSHELSTVAVTSPTLERAFWVKSFRSDIGESNGSPLFFDLLADGRTANTATARGQAPSSPVYRRYWRRLDDGRIEMSAARAADCVVFLPDGTPGPTPCLIDVNRFWEPVALSGQTLWVLQRGPYLPAEPEDPRSSRWSLVALTWPASP